MSSYAVWSGNGHTILYAPYTYKSVVGIEHYWNPDATHEFFSRHWSSSIYLALGYVVLINVMQRVMENRKPLNIKWILLFWNSALAMFSMMGTWRFGLEFYNMLTTRYHFFFFFFSKEMTCSCLQIDHFFIAEVLDFICSVPSFRSIFQFHFHLMLSDCIVSFYGH
ncbi:hypothetical protein COOONC_24936 [Cooperia oncophora]